MNEKGQWNGEAQKELRELMWKMGLCHCGTGSEAELSIMLEMLKRAADPSEDRISFYVKAEDASERWVEFAAKVLDSFGLLEHGTGIGWAWITDEGRLFMRFLLQFGLDDDKWPEWAESEMM